MKKIVVFIVVIITAGISIYVFWPHQSSKEKSQASKQPLYWVAPMDPNYRRNKPGKSPMGMDLVPVYAKATQQASSDKGIIQISPDVVNNLGVRTVKVRRGVLHPVINTVGYVKYDEDHLVHLHPRIKGWVEKLFVTTAGDPVKKGQAIYALYSPELVTAQEELLLALKRNNPALIRAAKSRLHALQLSPQFIQELGANKKVKQNVQFFSPQDGVVDNLNIREGFFVTPATTLMSIADLSQVWVEAEVFEQQVSWLQAGLAAEISLDAFPGKSWQSTIDYIAPTLNAKTRTAQVRLRIANEDGMMKPNMFAHVTIQVNSQQEKLLVPHAAVIRMGDHDRVVLALGKGKFKSIAVKKGHADEQYTEIVSGLHMGDKVVTSAQFLLDSESSKTSDFMRMHHQGASQ